MVSSSDSSIIAVHACGFAGPHDICRTFLSRIEKTADLVREIGPRSIMISGGVKYAKNSSHLLVYYGVLALQKVLSPHLLVGSNCKVIHAFDGYNSSTDIQNFLRIAEKQKSSKIIVVSSSWHHGALKPLYAYWIKKERVSMAVEFVSSDHDGAGVKTKCFYFVYSFLIRLSLIIGLFKIFDRALNAQHSKRISDYPVSGCD